MLNIVAVNFSFDISVKLHSGFLFLLSLLLLFPYAQRLYRFFILQAPSQLHDENIPFTISPALKTAVKTFAVCVVLFEAFYPFLKTTTLNDDMAARPYLHGAYEIVKDSSDGPPIKRFFVHRDGYLIFQNDWDEMKDYKLFVDTITHQFTLFDYDRTPEKMKYEFSARDSVLTLHYFYRNRAYLLKGKGVNWRDLPAIRQQFHWTVEGIR
jgi:hypothetical protein